jgi:hypothetical protein
MKTVFPPDVPNPGGPGADERRAVFKGTRVPVDSLFTNLVGESQPRRRSRLFPDVTREQAAAVLKRPFLDCPAQRS